MIVGSTQGAVGRGRLFYFGLIVVGVFVHFGRDSWQYAGGGWQGGVR